MVAIRSIFRHAVDTCLLVVLAFGAHLLIRTLGSVSGGPLAGLGEFVSVFTRWFFMAAILQFSVETIKELLIPAIKLLRETEHEPGA
jgi:hypothetical protein